MIFTCEKQEILEGISTVQKAITGKSTMPILEGIYIKTNETSLTLIGSDMDVSIQTTVNANIIEQGRIVIDAKIFGEIIRKLPNATIKIETLENQIIRITCEKSVFDVVYMNTNEFPELPKINEDLKISVKQNILKNMIKGTSFAIAQDETRPILQGILFEVKNKNLNLVALDGYRLAIKSEFLDIFPVEYVWYVSVEVSVVQSISNYEYIFNFKTAVIWFYINFSSRWFVKKHTSFN